MKYKLPNLLKPAIPYTDCKVFMSKFELPQNLKNLKIIWNNERGYATKVAKHWESENNLE